MTKMYAFFLAALAALALTGCGLVSTDVADFDLSMPERSFTIDSAQWGLTSDATFPAVDCSTPGSNVCSAAVMAACNSSTCFGSCDGTNCQATVLVALWRDVNLYEEKPELKSINDQPLLDVTIDRMQYDVAENTMNVQMPEFTMYVAPMAVMSPGDPQAEPIGSITSLSPGATLIDAEVNLTPEGRASLRQFMGDYKTTFNIIVAAEVVIQAGDPVPSGRIEAKLRVDAHAGI